MLEQIMKHFPGVSCACMDETGKVTTEYYGVSDKEKNILVDENTIFLLVQCPSLLPVYV